MRISAKSAAEREAYVLQLFIDNPTLSGPKANTEVKKKFGSMMRMARIYELRDQAKDREPSAGRQPKLRAGRQPAPASSPFPLLIKIRPGEAQVLKKALTQLREVGVTNLKVDASKEDWAVIDLA